MFLIKKIENLQPKKNAIPTNREAESARAGDIPQIEVTSNYNVTINNKYRWAIAQIGWRSEMRLTMTS